MKLITELEFKERLITKQLLKYGLSIEEINKLSYKQKLSALQKAKSYEVNIESEANRYF